MNNLQKIFDYKGKQVRTVIVDGNPWFVVKDTCEILELSNPSEAISRVEKDDLSTTEVIDSMGRKQVANTVSESGLYDLIFLSRKPEAKQFKRWITHDVLPSIRRTGMYAIESLSRLQILEMAIASEKQKLDLETKVKELEPKAEFFDAVADSKTAIPMAHAAKVLDMKGFGRNNLFKTLREKKILDRENIPYQEFVDRGYFRVTETKYTTQDGETKINIKTLVYQKGLDFIRRLLTKSNLVDICNIV